MKQYVVLVASLVTVSALSGSAVNALDDTLLQFRIVTDETEQELLTALLAQG
jgi:hypothetical protein